MRLKFHGAVALALTLVAPAAKALSSSGRVTQYTHESWSSREGLPEGAVFALHQTGDGYLWLGTQSGLVRFDGSTFGRFASGKLGLGQSSFARDLTEDATGGVWAALVGGVARYDGERFSWFDERAGFTHPFVHSLTLQGEQLWAGTGGAGVWGLRSGRFAPHPAYTTGQELPGKINVLAVDAAGKLWAGTDVGLLALDGTPRRVTSADGLPSDVVNALLVGRDGVLWVGTPLGLSRSRDGGVFEREASLGGVNVTALLQDREQNLWVGTSRGLLRLTDGRAELMPGEAPRVSALAEDHDGALWVGTPEGLERYRDGLFVTTGRPEGLAEEQLLSILPRRAGGMWVLDAMGAVWRTGPAAPLPVAPPATVSGTGMLGLAETDDGSLWVASSELVQLKDGTVTRYRREGGGFSVLERDGRALLVAQTATHGKSSLFHFADGVFSPIEVPAELPHGRLWISTSGAGLVRHGPEGTRVFKAKDGLPSDVVYGLAEDEAGRMWVATRTGLARITGDEVVSYAKVARAPTRSTIHVQLDGLGYLWVTADDGVYRLSTAELDQVSEGGQLSPDIFARRDGLRSVEVSWRCSGQAMLDGRLVYATTRGLASADPKRASQSRPELVVTIEAVTLAGRELEQRGGKIEVANRRDPLQVRYSSAALERNGDLEFRSQLVGYDSGWVTSTGRAAHYGNLPPGAYTFRVTARRPGAPWSSRVATISVRVLPRWHETPWARSAAALALAALSYGLYRLKLLRVLRSEQALTRRIEERTEQLRREVREREVAEATARELAAEMEGRVRDRTAELELANRAARKSEERYALAVRGAEDGLWDWDLAGGFMYWSPRFKQMLGYADSELAASLDAWFDLVHPEDLEGLRGALSLTPEHPGHIRHEYRMRDKTGVERWFLCRGVVIFDEQRNAVRAAGSQTDISHRKQAEDAQRMNATHDALTGLPNRSLFADRLEQAVLHTRQHSVPFALLFVDIDHFKSINESFGRDAGDAVLIEMGRRLRAAVRDVDTVARLGSDEFAILLPQLPAADATQVAELIQRAVSRSFELGGSELEVAASVGIKLSSTDSQSLQDFLRDAEMALAQAKSSGPGRHQLFHPQLRREADERLRVEAGLRRALNEGEFVLHYQPLVSLKTGAALSVEALIRWQDPERGLVGPNQFIAIAEACGLMLPLSDWVLSAACAQAKRWQTELASPVRIAINLPPVLLNAPGLANRIEAELARHAVPPSALGIEIVESSVLESHAAAGDNLSALRQMGVQIAIDDFGTGYSSFSYLKRLPVSYLKLDRSFTHRIPMDPADTAICRALLAMATQLKLLAVAEGVETKEQAAWLAANGCSVAQGYYFSRALPALECTEFLRANQAASRGELAFSPTAPAVQAVTAPSSFSRLITALQK
jgi:diguanylate cyclase (GGDEF)-like protein/PAS domain S-box-containing protein